MDFVFQGGGAKLVPLIAAAHAVSDLSRNKKVPVERVSGTSAGSIAATVLALDIDPVLFRQRLLELTPIYFPKIVRKISLLRSAPKVLRGVPLYDRSEYEDFLEKLFTLGGRNYKPKTGSCLPSPAFGW